MATKTQEIVMANVIKQAKSSKKISISKAMKDAGLSDSYSKASTQLTNTKGWKELVEKHMPDSFLTKRHRQLFDQKKVEYFSFGLKKTDDEITQAVEDAGLELINISYTTDSKLAWYSVPDVHAVTKALEMAHKIKGVYMADKTLTPAVTINHNLFYNPNFQEALRDAEQKMKAVIINAQPSNSVEGTQSQTK